MEVTYDQKYYESKSDMLNKKYAISLKDYDNLLIKQGHKCGNKHCSRDFYDIVGVGVFHVDHDHATGNIRGLLCHECNTGLGKLGDNVAGLASMIRYLATHNTGLNVDDYRPDICPRSRIHTFVHQDHGIVRMTRTEHKEKYGVNIKTLFRGKKSSRNQTAKGWMCLTANPPTNKE